MFLVLIAVADELQSGVPVVGADALGPAYALDPGVGLFGALLAGPTALGLLVEPTILAWSDRTDRRRVLLAALAGMVMFAVAAAVAPSVGVLTAALGLWGTACGIASGVAQGALVHGPDGAEIGMARWIRGAVAGDLAAPVLMAATGGDWRLAMVAGALVPLVAAIALARRPLPPLPVEEDDAPLGAAARAAISDPALIAWSLAVASCALLDEILLLLVVLRSTDATLPALALLAGGAVGGFATEPLLDRVATRKLLLVASVVSGAALAIYVWLPLTALPALFALGASAAQLFPLAQAQAYARLPGRPGLLNALQTPLQWLDVAQPLVMGGVVASFGIEGALLSLLLQPVTVAAVAWGAGRGGSAVQSERA